MPSTGRTCADCLASNAQCGQAYYNLPGTSCGLAKGTSATGRVLTEPMCCPQVYGGAQYRCRDESYPVVVAGVQYEVAGFSCQRGQSGLGAAAMVGIMLAVALVCTAALVLGCRYYRRRMLHTHAAALLDEPLEEERAQGGYMAPPLRSQPPPPPQPYSTQPFNLSMQPQDSAS